MKNRSLLLALATTAALAGASSAMAGAEVGSWYVAPQAVYVDPDKNYQADESVGGSLAIGKVLSKNWDGELAYIDSRHDVTGGGSQLKLNGPSLNLNRVFMRDHSISPFIGVGINVINSRKDGTGETNRDLGAAIKAGLLADLTKSGSLQLSGEVGWRVDNFSDHLEDVFGGLGLRFNFGAPAKAAAAPVAAPAAVPVAAAAVVAAPVVLAPPADSDHDGVIDSADKCPDTPAGVKVDADGCGLSVNLQVQFDTDSATLKQESYAGLDTVVEYLNKLPSVKGELQGHTDNAGKDSYNLKLSQRRADSVKAYLVGKGVDATRLTAKGYGETMPVADNATEEGRAANRRVLLVRSDVTN